MTAENRNQVLPVAALVLRLKAPGDPSQSIFCPGCGTPVNVEIKNPPGTIMLFPQRHGYTCTCGTQLQLNFDGYVPEREGERPGMNSPGGQKLVMHLEQCRAAALSDRLPLPAEPPVVLGAEPTAPASPERYVWCSTPSGTAGMAEQEDGVLDPIHMGPPSWPRPIRRILNWLFN
jgi:hypothetical protein